MANNYKSELDKVAHGANSHGEGVKIPESCGVWTSFMDDSCGISRHGRPT